MTDEIDDIISRLDEHEERLEELEDQVNTGMKLDKELSISEFVNNECEPSSQKEKVTTIGYYLEAYDGVDVFDKNDLEEGYERAGMSKPSNTSARVSDAVSEGWLDVAKADQPREWTLTKTGAEMVEALQGDTDG